MKQGKWHGLLRDTTTLEVALAAAFFTLGALVYAGARTAGGAMLIPSTLGFVPSLPILMQDWFSPVTGSLPTFAHTVAFALFTSALALRGPRRAAAACALWFVIEVLLEAGQADPVARTVAELLPGSVTHLPLLDHTAAYFLHGTFDPLDLAAAAMGAVMAYLILRRIHREEHPYAR